MCVVWVRAHLQKERSRVEGREDRRKAVVRVVSGQLIDSAFPSTVLGFTFHVHSAPKLEDFATGRGPCGSGQ